MLVVQKFGGTSVADVERIRTVAGRIARTRAAGHEVVVVVSAMAGETNRLLALAKATARTPDERESDALVVALDAEVSEIYTDVQGVYTSDPRIVPQARKLERITYDEMLELASLGAKVLQIRSVEFAKRYRVPVHVRSSFSEAEGTWVVEEDPAMEEVSVAGVAYDRDEAKLTVLRVPDRPGLAARVFGPIARANI